MRCAAMLVLMVSVMGVGVARADGGGVCEELHCYCDGPDEPDTVASCDTTCEAVCSGATSGEAAVAHTARLARWGLAATVGPSFTSRDASGETTPDGGSYGGELDARFGRRAAGILVRLALTSTPIEGASVGLARERAVVFDWFDLGLEVSPRAAGGRRWELRPTAAVWFASTALLACGGCDDATTRGGFSGGYGAIGWGARFGFDLYFGAHHARGVTVALVYADSEVGSIAEGLGGTPTEHVAPRLSLQLGLTTMLAAR